MMFPGLLLGAPPIGLQRLGQIAVEVHRAGVEGLLPLSGYVGLRGNNELAVGSWVGEDFGVCFEGGIVVSSLLQDRSLCAAA